jgi:putative addiction module killer protein
MVALDSGFAPEMSWLWEARGTALRQRRNLLKRKLDIGRRHKDRLDSPLTMVSYVLPLGMVEVREYLDRSGRSPFAAWSDRLNREAAAKVAAALARIQQGNFSSAKGVGSGVYEYRIDFGPGYRIYFGKDGDTLVILIGGGTKKRQQEDIATALGRWQDYKQRKGTGR